MLFQDDGAFAARLSEKERTAIREAVRRSERNMGDKWVVTGKRGSGRALRAKKEREELAEEATGTS